MKDALRTPGALLRPAPFWSWNDRLEPDELRRQIRLMAKAGWGSFFMHSRVGLVTDYLSDSWMEAVAVSVDEAEKRGMKAWLYDEDMWPSGFAGGMVPQADPSFRLRVLLLTTEDLMQTEDILLARCRHQGRERVICRRVAPLGNARFKGASYVDMMNPEAVKYFLDVTLKPYAARFGDRFGGSIPGIFTDEPTYMMFSVNPPEYCLPWSEGLPDFFWQRHGYDIGEHLPSLFFEEGDYRRIRHDFYESCSARFRESFTRQYYERCTELGLRLTGHFNCEDGLTFQSIYVGDVMAHYQFMHWPGIDKLGRNVGGNASLTTSPRLRDHTLTVMQLVSVVEQLGKEGSLSEVFGCMGGQCSFFHRKWIADWQAALGVGFVNHHLSLFSMRGERKRDYPANLFYPQPWWPEERGLSDYLARLGAAVSSGQRQADILLLQPLESVWCELSPLHADDEYARERVYETPFARLLNYMTEAKFAYHLGNEEIMAGHALLDGRRLRIGQYSYGTVVVPPLLTLRASTAELLRSFAAAGGRLLFAGEYPQLEDARPARQGFPGAVQVDSWQTALKMLDQWYEDRLSVTDRYTGRNAERVLVNARADGGTRWWFIANTDEKREVRVEITWRLSPGELSAVMDLSDGRIFRLNEGGGSLICTIHPAGSLLMLSGQDAMVAEEAPPMLLGSGVAFDRPGALPSAEVTLIEPALQCLPMEDNLLPLVDYDLWLDGKMVYSGPVCGAWHTCFYPAPEGTPFKAEYRFMSQVELDGCQAAVEMAWNLESLLFNGQPVRPLLSAKESLPFNPELHWKDICYARVPLPKVCRGVNRLVIEGRKVNNITGRGMHSRVADGSEHRPTEAEEVYILGPFCLVPMADREWQMAPWQAPGGVDLNKEGFPFYAGRLLYKGEFRLERPVPAARLILRGLEAASMRVRLNGVEQGVLRWPPHMLPLKDLQPGSNLLEMELATTLVNAFGPNRTAGIKEYQYISPGTFTRDYLFTDAWQLFPCGLLSAAVELEQGCV